MLLTESHRGGSNPSLTAKCYNKMFNTYASPISNVKDITPFAPLVVKAIYRNFNWPVIKNFCENITKEVDPKMDTHWATGDTSNETAMPHLNTIFKKYYDWMNPIAMDVITKQFGYDKNMNYVIYNSWINLHIPGGSTPMHHHGPSVLSVATYLYMPENGGYIEFKDPLEYHKTPFPTTIDDEISNWKSIPTKTGDVIMFPGWLRHRTQTNKSKEKRWVLTTNYICTNIPKNRN